jgi:hypothetical protein
MPGSATTPGLTDARTSAPVRVAFRPFNSVGTRDQESFAAQWLAYALPYRRFARTLADTGARLGADADRYSFIAADLHHLLLAGFTGALKVTLQPDRTVAVQRTGGQCQEETRAPLRLLTLRRGRRNVTDLAGLTPRPAAPASRRSSPARR